MGISGALCGGEPAPFSDNTSYTGNLPKPGIRTLRRFPECLREMRKLEPKIVPYLARDSTMTARTENRHPTAQSEGRKSEKPHHLKSIT
jgi:hypothetical protein